MDSNQSLTNSGVELFHYQLGKRIRLDADGELFEAFDPNLSRAVWIRKISYDCVVAAGDQFSASQQPNKSEQAFDHLLQRVRMVASLQHAAFVRIHSVEVLDQCVYVVMEAVTGQPLNEVELISDKQVGLVKYLFEVASALSEAHALGLVHGNLRPENLLLDRSGHIRILNFSLLPFGATGSIDLDAHSDSFSNLAYLAPERFTQPTPQTASDLYAIGLSWYLFFCGCSPFSEMSGIAQVASKLQLSSTEWFWPQNMADAVRDLLQRLTSKDASLRPTATELRTLCFPLIPTEMWSQSLSKEDLRRLKQEAQESLQSMKKELDTAALKSARYRLKPYYLMVSVSLVFVSLLIWQSVVHWGRLQSILTPYSSASEMKQGIHDLTEYQIRPRAILLASAIQHFQTVLEHEPQNAEAVAYMSLGQLSNYYASTRDEIWFQRAKAGAQQAILLAPQAAPSLLAQARIQQGHHQLEEALRNVELALQKEPELLLSWHCKMSILLEAGKREEALKFGALGSGKFPKDRFLLDLMAAIHLEQGHYDQAKRLLEESIRRQPESQLAYALLAYVLNAQNKRDEALSVIQQGLLLGPFVNLYDTLGALRFQEGDFEAAAQAYENSVSINKGVAGSYLRWFQYAEALIQLPTRKADAHFAFQKARDLIELRLRRSTDDPILLSISAVIEARLERVELAHEQIRKTLDLPRLTGESYFWLALSYQILGETEKAVAALARSRQLNFDPRIIASYPDLKSL